MARPVPVWAAVAVMQRVGRSVSGVVRLEPQLVINQVAVGHEDGAAGRKSIPLARSGAIIVAGVSRRVRWLDVRHFVRVAPSCRVGVPRQSCLGGRRHPVLIATRDVLDTPIARHAPHSWHRSPDSWRSVGARMTSGRSSTWWQQIGCAPIAKDRPHEQATRVRQLTA